MLLDVLERLNSFKIVLASGSPRRIEYLSKLGLKFEIVESKFEENLDKSKFSSAYDYCLENAKLKAIHTNRQLFEKNNKYPNITIGADSIVVYNNKIFEKPKSLKEAKEMLAFLSGKSHFVCTAVHIEFNNESNQKKGQESFYTLTQVEFDNLSSDLIEYYVENYKPLDKAGSYGIQEIPAGSFIKRIDGDFYNVTGMPIHDISIHLRKVYDQNFK
ncbi:hypothetical protein DICPUDRAFT_38848 [Dictyostelium purpureum]|uniref:Uncharacterized protein n=1 Tax=Dictyostelium purpureum TaxID=5786 RepID=F0ZVB2_DICPU|nr:uncharacterized protein DICPUDRAFT_38848 [Dictyostelium purpureum]EGC32104.1 hypothetical protein DICPUDRAFT_38848 [Dictyostelium purpureum]|eukprot:XP_003291354.1 hypothetical protein DICPUDRAFT_38848 [Dictyostelium purpureum]